MHFAKTSALIAALVSVASAQQEWGSFAGEVDTIKHVSGETYALTSDLTVSLNEGWTLVDLVGRSDGQISNKTIVYNSADSKYYGKIAYTNTATVDNSTTVCFPSVPIRISLNEKVDDTTTGRLIDGNFYIGCIDKSRISGESSASSGTATATDASASATDASASASATDASVTTEASASASASATDASAATTAASAPVSGTATGSAEVTATDLSSRTLSTSYVATSASSTGVAVVHPTSGTNQTNTTTSSGLEQVNSGVVNSAFSAVSLGMMVVAFVALA